MLKRLIVYILVLFQLIAYSQNKHRIDSLSNLAQQTKIDSIKAHLYLKISSEYWSDDPAKCKEFAFKALNISKIINSHNLMYGAYKNIGSASSNLDNMKEALYYDRKCLKEAILSGNDKNILNICVNLGNDLTTFSQFDSANLILDLGIKIAKKYDDKKQLCDLYINKGNNLYYFSQYDSSEFYFQSGLKQSVALGDTESMVMLYNNIASIRLHRGISDSVVINYLMKAISINEKRKDFLNLGDCYSTLASAYNIQKNNEKAIHYLKIGIESFTKAHNETKTVNLLVSIADLFRDLNLNDSAAFYAEMAIERGERNQFKHGLAAAYSIKGRILCDKSAYGQAESYLQKAFLEFSETNDGEGMLFSGNYLAIVLMKQKKYKMAESVGGKVFRLADTLKNYQASKTASMTLSEIFHTTGNDAKAYEYLKYFIAADDTIMIAQNARLLEEMVTKYETKKKDNKILMLNNYKLVSEKKILQQSRSILLIAFIAILLFLAAIIFFLLSRQRKIKYNLQIQKMEMKFLRSQLKPHFICNALLAIRNYIRQHPEVAEEYLDKYSTLMREVLINSELETVSLEDEFSMLKKYMDLESLRVNNGFNYEFTIDSSVDPDAVKVPPLIFQPIVENAIWHGIAGRSEKGKISIHVSREEKILKCVVENYCSGAQMIELEAAKKEKSFGLKISRDRLYLLSKEKRSIWYMELIPVIDGMKVQLGIPL
ncbi:MAG: histidine kinase [Bacteroidetes bacterium]|nr:histidine kinase [Bacteroidota bacterium]